MTLWGMAMARCEPDARRVSARIEDDEPPARHVGRAGRAPAPSALTAPLTRLLDAVGTRARLRPWRRRQDPWLARLALR